MPTHMIRVAQRNDSTKLHASMVLRCFEMHRHRRSSVMLRAATDWYGNRQEIIKQHHSLVCCGYVTLDTVISMHRCDCALSGLVEFPDILINQFLFD